MNTAPATPFAHSAAMTAGRADPARWLYSSFALLLLLLTLLGFQQFYLAGRAFPGRELLPQAKPLVIVHGVLMSAWIVLFVVQPLLIAGRQRRRHIALGTLGMIIAAGMVIVGPLVSIAVTRFGPEFPLWGLNRRQFMAVPLISILAFGGFVLTAFLLRRRPAIHKPMMLLATLTTMAAATDRIGFVHGLFDGIALSRIFGPFLPTLVIGAAFLVLSSVLRRSFDRWFAIGFAVLVVVSAGIMQLATTAPWFAFASFLVG